MSIFWNIDSYLSVIEKPLGILTSSTVNCGNGVYLLKAGTPISNAGAVANTGDAKYLVAEDFYFYSNTPTQPKLVKLIETGYVDINAAEAAAGITYADACKSALATAGIILVDGALETGGGGGGVLVAHAEVPLSDLEPSGEPVTITLDKTISELAAAEDSILEIVTETNGGMDFFIPLSLVMRQTADGSAVVAYASMASADDLLQARLYVQGMSSGGSDMVMLMAAAPSGGGDEPFVLHGTMVDVSGGTVSESVADLVAAIMAGKRIVFHMEPVEGVYSNVEMINCTIADGSSPYCMASYATGGVLACIAVTNSSNALVFTSETYALPSNS